MAFPNATNITDIKGLFDYAEDTTGVFYNMGLFSLWVIIFLWLKGKNYQTADCALSASFVTLLASGFVFLMGGIGGFELSVVVIAMIVSVLFAMWHDRD